MSTTVIARVGGTNIEGKVMEDRIAALAESAPAHWNGILYGILSDLATALENLGSRLDRLEAWAGETDARLTALETASPELWAGPLQELFSDHGTALDDLTTRIVDLELVDVARRLDQLEHLPVPRWHWLTKPIAD